jgi:hypothetical protein
MNTAFKNATNNNTANMKLVNGLNGTNDGRIGIKICRLGSVWPVVGLAQNTLPRAERRKKYYSLLYEGYSQGYPIKKG